jgi:hypothetical protein
MFENPYLEGEPHGQVEILFSDGGLYRGVMTNGKIEGPGEYQSALGELIIGNFKNGILHGENGYIKNLGGEKFKGEFVDGEITKLGIYENERGDTYEGVRSKFLISITGNSNKLNLMPVLSLQYFDGGLRHGRGNAKFRGRGYYRGYYLNNSKSGKGELAFGKMKKKKSKSKQEGKVDGKSNSGEAKKDTSQPNKDIMMAPEFRFTYQGKQHISNSHEKK